MCDNQETVLVSRCPYWDTCDIIQGQHHKLPTLADRFEQTYCLGNYNGCSRRWIRDFLGAEKVPELMLPHQYEWAQQILTESGIGYTAFRQKFRRP